MLRLEAIHSNIELTHLCGKPPSESLPKPLLAPVTIAILPLSFTLSSPLKEFQLFHSRFNHSKLKSQVLPFPAGFTKYYSSHHSILQDISMFLVFSIEERYGEARNILLGSFKFLSWV